jgi:hypothetical protein
MRREEQKFPWQAMESGKGGVHAGCPSTLHVAHQRALRIDGVGKLGQGTNIENADQSAVAQEMNPTMPRVRSVRSLSGGGSPAYLWFTYGIGQKGPAKMMMIVQ